MRFEQYITDSFGNKYGKGITFVDIDDTLFHTFAKIAVIKSGKVVRELDNQEYNSYELKTGESYDFDQFRDGKLFRETSIPIPQTVNRIKKMLSQIKSQDNGSKIVFLTARESFTSSPKEFYKTFKEHGIPIDKSTTDVVFAGDTWKRPETIDTTKKNLIMKYIKTGEYRRVRILDDHKPNVKAIKDLEKNIPKAIEQKVIDNYGLDMETETLPPISFYALYVKPDGSLQQL
jgi:hypothetical protein